MAPPTDCLKLNFDGSSLGNSSVAGIGGVVRDSTASIIFSFAGLIGVRIANYAELSALLCGVKVLVDKFSGCSCIFEGDSLNVVKWCKKEQRLPWELHGLWLQVMDIVEIISVSFVHVFREANALADSLAKSGAHLSSLVVSNDVISLPTQQ
ncbi:uncharacterized protein LOC105420388 [Amborella trichopoda]|uniref:uncharacterized protein LOC105420388 n=1 Tax=Amborella trichopoda TaxID=13333 RepID=UPI0005D36E0D|nr:uncharacterized protein LOC105420388 [Amborella trichopoda]|eukprot:XP_011622116.1 uncharacterized protein LOC105420388 [Amborella trichopoda]